jgi:hypothetical protein
VATTSWAENAALATDRQHRMQADAVRQRRISEAEHATNAAMRQVRYRDVALVALVVLFALLSFSLGEEDANARRIRSNIVDPADVVLVERAAEDGIPTS